MEIGKKGGNKKEQLRECFGESDETRRVLINRDPRL